MGFAMGKGRHEHTAISQASIGETCAALVRYMGWLGFLLYDTYSDETLIMKYTPIVLDFVVAQRMIL